MNAYFELAQHPNWVLWKPPSKAPLNPVTGKPASTTDPTTWTDHKTAYLQAKQQGSKTGFVFTPKLQLVGIDLDGCIENGRLQDWARDILRRVNSFAELSPSGTGVHIIARGTLPGPDRHPKGVGMFTGQRYFTVTGRRLTGVPGEIQDRSDELASLYRELFPQPRPTPGYPVPLHQLSDEEVIRRARMSARFAELWDGNFEVYGISHSEADVSVCRRLAKFTQDPAQLDRVFRQSKLIRPKWDARRLDTTYGGITIRYALGK